MNTVQPGPITSGNYIGTLVEQVKARNQYRLDYNRTISCHDDVFGDSIVAATAAEAAQLRTPRGLVVHYEKSVWDHAERRAAIAFQQFVTASETELHFKIGKTIDQGESTPALHIVTHNGQKSKLTTRNAAHSSTLPCLIAYYGDEWNAYIQQKAMNPRAAIKPQGFVYMKDSYTYVTANSTKGLPRMVNEADIALDGNENHGLRAVHLELMNRVSTGELSPDLALKVFLAEAVRLADAAIPQANEGVSAALSMLSATFKSIQERIEVDDNFFDHLLGVHIGANAVANDLKSTIYRLRYKAIQEHQLAESRIFQRINKLGKDILVGMAIARKPEYFERAIEISLAKEMVTDENRKRLAVLLGNTEFGTGRETADKLQRLNKTLQKLAPFHAQIRETSREIKSDFRELTRIETEKRGDVSKVIRTKLHWSQKKLAEVLKQRFPNSPASQTTMSRIETHIRSVDKKYAENLAAVYDVPAALFFTDV